MPKEKVTTIDTTKKKTTQKKKTTIDAETNKTAKTTAARSATKPRSIFPGDKRKHLRLHYSRLISFVYYDRKGHLERPEGMAAIRDLSQAGILVETGVPFEPGDNLALDIAFEQERIIPTHGKIIHIRKTTDGLYEAGLRFTKIRPKDLAYLKGFVDGQRSRC
jgi:hypothetical protein